MSDKKEEAAELKGVSSTEGKGDNKVEKTIRVEEIENGFIVVEEKNWNDKKKGYQYETKKFFSEKNPLSEQNKLISAIKKNLQ